MPDQIDFATWCALVCITSFLWTLCRLAAGDLYAWVRVQIGVRIAFDVPPGHDATVVLKRREAEAATPKP